MAAKKVPALLERGVTAVAGSGYGGIAGGIAGAIADFSTSAVAMIPSLVYGANEIMKRCEVPPVAPSCGK